MEKSARKYTPGSNLAAMSPEGRARAEAFLSDEFGQMLVDNLNRNVLKHYEMLEKEAQEKKDQPQAKD